MHRLVLQWPCQRSPAPPASCTHSVTATQLSVICEGVSLCLPDSAAEPNLPQRSEGQSWKEEEKNGWCLWPWGPSRKRPTPLDLGSVTAEGNGTQPSPEDCKVRLPGKEFQSTQVTQSLRERLVRDWDPLSREMHSLCPDVWRAGLSRWPSQPECVSSVGSGPAPPLDSSSEPPVGSVSLSLRVKSSRNLHRPNQRSSPGAANQGHLGRGRFLKRVIFLSHSRPPQSL